MKQSYKKIIALALFSFGAVKGMNSSQTEMPRDVDDEAPILSSKETSIAGNGLKAILKKQILRGRYENNPYVVLGITKKTSQNEIEDVAKKMLFHFHSDKNNGDDFLSKEITDAKARAIAQKNFQLGLTYGIQKFVVKSVVLLVQNDVKLLTDQIATYLVVEFLRTKVATPIRRLFIQSDDELEKLQEKLYLLRQENEDNNSAIKKLHAQVNALKAFRLELKTQKLNKQLKMREKSQSRENFLQGFKPLQMPLLHLQAAPEDNDKKADLQINMIHDQILEQSSLQKNENVLVDI